MVGICTTQFRYLKDPVFDFVAGTKIYLPDPTALRTTLGL